MTNKVVASDGSVHEDFLDFVPVPKGRRGKVEVKLEARKAGAEIPFGSLRTMMFAGDSSAHVTYPKKTLWRRLVHDDLGTWMTDLPIEQVQMREQMAPMSPARSILIGGLGLGISAKIAARVRGIERVVVIEKDPDVIRLVAPTLNELPEGEVIEVVNADLFAYLAKAPKDGFGWAFFDIWQSDSEDTFHNVVVPLRKLAAGRGFVPSYSRVICWNEGVMRGQLALKLRGLILMLTSGGPMTFPGKPTLEDLVRKDGIYHDWSIPFWRWFRKERPSRADALAFAQDYVALYGSERSWQRRWQEITSNEHE